MKHRFTKAISPIGLKKKSKHYVDFSKRVVFAGLIGVAALMAYSMVMGAVLQDASIVSEIIDTAKVIATAIIGFYMWRAKSKDKLKLRKQYGESIFNDADIGNE